MCSENVRAPLKNIFSYHILSRVTKKSPSNQHVSIISYAHINTYFFIIIMQTKLVLPSSFSSHIKQLKDNTDYSQAWSRLAVCVILVPSHTTETKLHKDLLIGDYIFSMWFCAILGLGLALLKKLLQLRFLESGNWFPVVKTHFVSTHMQ